MSGLDLYQTQRTLALLLVNAALGGFLMGGVYDLLRALRILLGEQHTAAGQGRRPLPRAILLFFEDMLFALLWTAALILLCYYQNDGRIRAPGVLGMAAGFFVYRQTLSRLTLPLTRWLAALLRRGLRFALRLVLRPLGWILDRTVGRAVRARRERITEAGIAALTEAADRGFGIMEGSASQDTKNTKKPPAA